MRIVFDQPVSVHRMELRFDETGASALRSSSFVGPLKQAGQRRKLCGNNGTSALQAQRRRLNTLRSIWTPSQFWN
jgi:hypothetical protein